MHERTTARFVLLALSVAALTAIARPASACEADEEPCGSGCMPAGYVCCATVGLDDGWCKPGWYCWGGGMCVSGTGPTAEQEIINGNGAPYGPSLERSCGVGHAGGGGGGAALIAIAAGWLARRRAARCCRK